MSSGGAGAVPAMTFQQQCVRQRTAGHPHRRAQCLLWIPTRLSMTAMTTRLLYSLMALLAVLGLCAFAASALLGWQPGLDGLPPDIAAIQQSAGQ